MPTHIIAKPASTPLAIHGGPRALDVDWPRWPIWDETERAELLETLDSGKWFYGEKVKRLEQRYADLHRVRFAVSCTNGTAAIEMGLRAMGISAGDEVIVPPYTFVATAAAVIAVGGVPVFADIEPDTLCIDPADVGRKITPRTRAIIPVHVAGNFADLTALRALAGEHGLKILEDAAHCWGSLYDGAGAGTIGDCATFSFQESKNITAGEGGILLTNDPQLAELCRSYSDCGRAPGSAWYQHERAGSNLRMTEFQAAILLAQLTRLDDQTARRARSAAILDARLADVPSIRLLRTRPGMTRRSYHMYIFRIDDSVPVGRQAVLAALNAEGVPASGGWMHPLYRNGVFQSAAQSTVHPVTAPLAGRELNYGSLSCPVCEAACEDAIWIAHTALLMDDAVIEQLAGTIIKVFDAVTELG